MPVARAGLEPIMGLRSRSGTAKITSSPEHDGAMSWLQRLLGRDGGSPEPTDAVDVPPPDPIVVEAFGPDGWRPLRLEVGPGRVSDAVNEVDRALRPSYLEPDDPGGASAGDAPDGLDLDDVLLMIPPADHAGDPQRRVRRPTHPLWVRIGPCLIVGSVHLPPGSVGTAYLLRRHPRFFILTDAAIQWPVANRYEERRVPVVLVNLQHVSSLRDTPEPEPAPSVEPSAPAESSAPAEPGPTV
jgi:hypothetical protein